MAVGFKSTWAANAVLAAMYGNTPFSAPVTWYLALFTSMPTRAGGGTEVGAADYARVGLTNDTTSFPLPADGQLSNGLLINYGTLANAWGLVVGAAWFTALSGGNFGHAGPFSTPRDLRAGDSFSIAVGGAIMTEE